MPQRPSFGGMVLAPDRKPRDEEIDVFGMTHPGRVYSRDEAGVGSLERTDGDDPREALHTTAGT